MAAILQRAWKRFINTVPGKWKPELTFKDYPDELESRSQGISGSMSYTIDREEEARARMWATLFWRGRPFLVTTGATVTIYSGRKRWTTMVGQASNHSRGEKGSGGPADHPEAFERLREA
ncbi:hypothetical protein QYE76_047483 [Lolium multiflorum]|uniref:Uncharacterized protein n=1 Tax=Lolium multiflorum TaxID=4521 RepID=A0AAD8TQ01_LOLMU|nr:hypothetical protein QYE76_047483 [Lolium multiflorum]